MASWVPEKPPAQGTGPREQSLHSVLLGSAKLAMSTAAGSCFQVELNGIGPASTAAVGLQAEANGDSAAAGIEAEDNPAKEQAAEFWAALQGKQPENGTAEVRVASAAHHSFSHHASPTLTRHQPTGPHRVLSYAETLLVIVRVHVRHRNHV